MDSQPEAVARSTPSRLSLRTAALLATALVVFRSFVFCAYEQSCFDGDQATFGLMAKQLLDGHALPLFMYGQRYLLAVSVWLAAPFVWLLGTTVLALKLPILLISLAIVVLLLRLMTREVGLTPFAGLAAILPFALPNPVVAARLTAHEGVSAEPFLWIALLWALRDRPLVFGIVAGIGFLNRPFALYGVLAVAALDLASGRLGTARAWRRWLKALAAASVTCLAVLALVPLSANASGAAPRLHWKGWPALELRWRSFATDYAPALAGHGRAPLSSQGVASQIETGSALVGPLLAVSGAIALTRVGLLLRRRRREEGRWLTPSLELPLYLTLVALLASATFVLVGRGGGRPQYIRYVLLVLLAAVGLAAAHLALERRRFFRAITLGALVLWSGLAAWDHARLLAEYARTPPPNPYRRLTEALERRGIAYGVAPYHEAYVVDYLSGERVRLDTYGMKRIGEYAALAERHRDPAVRILPAPCWAEPENRIGSDYCLEALRSTSNIQP